jgi:hypothetical protein
MYFGPDSFTFRVHDASVDSETATVSIVIDPVNDPPDAVSESIFLMKGETTSERAQSAAFNNSSHRACERHACAEFKWQLQLHS